MTTEQKIDALLQKVIEQEECEHHDMDDGHCLDCGADRTVELAADAYDRLKARRQDGEW